MFDKIKNTFQPRQTDCFRFAKIPYFLIYNNKIRICIKVLVKKGCRVSIVSVTSKRAEMAPIGEKGGIYFIFRTITDDYLKPGFH